MSNIKKKIVIETEGEAGNMIIGMLEHIKKTASIGHGFNIEIDPDDSEYSRTFYIDGDGADRIVRIKYYDMESNHKLERLADEIEEFMEFKIADKIREIIRSEPDKGEE